MYNNEAYSTQIIEFLMEHLQPFLERHKGNLKESEEIPGNLEERITRLPLSVAQIQATKGDFGLLDVTSERFYHFAENLFVFLGFVQGYLSENHVVPTCIFAVEMHSSDFLHFTLHFFERNDAW